MGQSLTICPVVLSGQALTMSVPVPKLQLTTLTFHSVQAVIDALELWVASICAATICVLCLPHYLAESRARVPREVLHDGIATHLAAPFCFGSCTNVGGSLSPQGSGFRLTRFLSLLVATMISLREHNVRRPHLRLNVIEWSAKQLWFLEPNPLLISNEL